MDTVLQTIKRLIKYLICILFILLTAATGYGQSFLEVPVRLDVEKGNLDDVVVKVQKDGKDAFTQSGASKMRFKLDYDRKYTLIFTKPGYVTKTIEINTSAPAARIAQKFDPYKIGVKIYKQGDEANKIAYNQPVARIKYDKNLDEFNFDTDYSKSILSALDNDDEKKDTATSKIAENNPREDNKKPEKLLPAAIVTSKPVSNTSTSTITASTSDDPSIQTNKSQEPKKSQPDPVLIVPDQGNDAQANLSAKAETEIPPKAVPKVENEHPAVTVKPATGNSQPNKLSAFEAQEQSILNEPANSEEKQPQTAIAMQGEEQSKKVTVKKEEEKPKIKSYSYQGQESSKAIAIPVMKSDSPENAADILETEKITRQDIVERNRVITIVKVMKGNLTVEYSRVNYSWGGLYFFKNNTTSIPENLFVQWTGVNN